jgi:hypothetical protein
MSTITETTNQGVKSGLDGAAALITPKQMVAKADTAATPTSARISNVNATDRTKTKMISADVNDDPVEARHFTTDTVRNHVTKATIAKGTPSPGAIVNTPRTTQISVTNIINEASEKPSAWLAGVPERLATDRGRSKFS